jgi:U3 small nucleolar RNA-associated protein MPP10
LINKTITDDIDKIESKMIGDKPWQMKGEITAKDRKKGSLLEQVVEYQVSIKPPPVPTPQFTNDIESMIIKRVKDGLFDNPVRKEHIDINEAPKKGEMKFDKSKKGLGEIYEDEYTEKVMHLPNETEQTEIKKEVDEIERRLFSVLDRLTNFNYVPKINKEMKVLTNVPSIALEDISNHLTDNKAFSKAPQELFNIKDTNFESKDEMSQSEKKNLHNKKKRNIRTHLRQKQQYNKLKNLYDKTGDKFEAKMLMRKEQDKKVNKESKVSDLKSGKFFNNMQKIVSNDIEKRNGKKEKNNSERGNNEQKIKNFKL